MDDSDNPVGWSRARARGRARGQKPPEPARRPTDVIAITAAASQFPTVVRPPVAQPPQPAGAGRALHRGGVTSEARSDGPAVASVQAITTGMEAVTVGQPGGRGAMRGRPPVKDEIHCRPPSCLDKRGTQGSPIDLLSNYVKVTSAFGSDFIFYQYRVDFSPSIESSKMRRAMLFDHLDVIGRSFVFDGMEDVKTTTSLEKDEMILWSKRRTDDENIQITVKRTGKLNGRHPEVLRLMNTQQRKNFLHMGFVAMGRNMFDKEAALPIEQYKIELWPGVLTAIRMYENSLLMVVDVIHKVVPRMDTVLQPLRQHYARDKNNYLQNCSKELAGCIVMTSYNNKTYSLDDFDSTKCPTDTFETRKTGLISYVEYYKIETFKVQAPHSTAEELSDGVALAQVLAQITETGRKFQNLKQKHEVLQESFFKVEEERNDYQSRVHILEKELAHFRLSNVKLSEQVAADELDFLKYRTEKIQLYESTIESLKKKMSNFNELQEQNKELKEENAIFFENNLQLEKENALLKKQMESFKETLLESNSKLSEETLRAEKFHLESKSFSAKLDALQEEKNVLGLTNTEDGSVYLRDQSCAIPCTVVRTSSNSPDEEKLSLCPVSHNRQGSNLNHLVSISTYEVVTEKSNLTDASPHTYILVKDADIISLNEKERKIPVADKEEKKRTEVSMNICKVFLPRKKSLAVLSNDEWKDQFVVEGVTISNTVVEMDQRDPDYRKDVGFQFVDIFDSDVASNLPEFLERRKKDLLVSNECLSLHPWFEVGKAVLVKIPVKVQIEEVTTEIRRFIIYSNNPMTLVKGTIIQPYGEAEEFCPKHSTTPLDKKDTKIKLVKEACFCSFITKYHSIDEVATHGEIYNPFDSIEVEGFVKEKWIVKNKEMKNECDPPLQISLVLADKENTSATLTLYITESHPDWTLYGLLPGSCVLLSGVKVLKAQQSGSYYSKSAKRFGLQVVDKNAMIEESFWNATKSPSPLKYFMRVNDNQPFRSLSTVIRVLSVEILECVSQASQIPPAKAKFILDDGSSQVTPHCTGVNVKHLLNISERQWQDLLAVGSSERGRRITF